MIQLTDNYICVKVPKGAGWFAFINIDGIFYLGWKYKHDDFYDIENKGIALGELNNFPKALGFAKDLTEDQWAEIVEKVQILGLITEQWEKVPYNYMTRKYCKTAKESGMTLLESKGASKDDLVIKI